MTQKWPELTLPEEEGKALREAYEQAGVILEYGSGGSTVLASRLPEKRVFSVESDRRWALSLQRMLDASDFPSIATLYHVDMGPSGAWGRPLNDREWPKFQRYPMGIWTESFFRHPDVILIDGRLRPACFVTACLQITKPVTILFDDYTNRPRYQLVEHLIKPVALIGRMAKFQIEPQTWPSWIQAFLNELVTDATYASESYNKHIAHYDSYDSVVLRQVGLI